MSTRLPGKMPSIQQHLGDVRGVIGTGVFSDYLITLDFAEQEFVLARGALVQGDGSVAYELDHDALISIALTIAGETVMSHVDTGNAGDLSVPARLLSKVRLDGEPFKMRARTASGEFDVTVGTLGGSVRLGGVTIASPEVHFTDRFDWGNIGSGLLSQYVVTIDQTRQRIRLIQGGVSHTQQRVAGMPGAGKGKSRRRYGFMLAMQPGRTIGD